MNYRKKPVVIQAIQYTEETVHSCESFLAGGGCAFISDHGDPRERPPSIGIETMEGTMRAELGDWIIKGVNGEFYPCKDEIFQKTYDPVQEQPR